NDTVAQVLRNRFKDGACDFIFGQLARVTPNDLSGEISGNIKISRAQRFDHSKGVLVETAQGEATEDPIDGNRRSSPSQCGGSENQADRENHEYQYQACRSLVRHDSSQQPFEAANEKADTFDRVGQPWRIADDEIQDNGYGEFGCGRFDHWSNSKIRSMSRWSTATAARRSYCSSFE